MKLRFSWHTGGACAAAFAFFAFFAAEIAMPADVVIDRSSEIVMPADAPYATRLAADELNFFLKGAFGAPLPVVGRQTAGKTAIEIGGGTDRESRHLGGGGRGTTALPDAYAIEAKSGMLRIVGDDDDVLDVTEAAALPGEAPWQPCFRRGTLFGVYAFLERFAGVRMYFPGELGTCIPKTARIVVPEGRIEEAPTFSVRRFGYADGPVAKELLGGMDETSFKRLNWYRQRMETVHLKCCHGAKTHCLSPATWNAIYTNACAILMRSRGMRDLTVSTVGRGMRPACPFESVVFDAMPKDGFTWLRHCKCEWCEKNIPFSKTDVGFATDLVWRRTAELASRLAARFPYARVSQMSYIPYVHIPTNDIPDNVDVFVARRGPWAEGTAIGAREKDEVRRWHAKLGRKVSLWNYPDKVECWNLEMKDVPQFAPRAWARYYRAVAPHVTGAFAESESDRWLYNYLNYHVFSRLCWNPECDVEAILAEHHRLMFGQAASEMAEFFDTLESCWMKVVAKPCDTPLGPGVCEAPTKDVLWKKIYSPEVMSRLSSLVSLAEAKVAVGSIEARRIALFRREYLAPLRARRMRAIADIHGMVARPARPLRRDDAVRIGLLADIHIGDSNDVSDLKRALRLFDAKKADAVLAAGDLTDLGLLSQLKAVAAAWNEVFPGNLRSDGEPVVRLFHYGDHDTALNFKARQAEVVAKGRWPDYIPHIGPAVAWECAFGEPFKPVVRRMVKGCEFTLVHFLPESGGVGTCRPTGNARLHVFSQHRAYRGLFARPGCGDEASWDDGASLAVITNVPNMIAVCGHAHISAANDTSFVPLPSGFAAVAIPSLCYQIETWHPKPKGCDSHQALFLAATSYGIAIERLDVRTGEKLGQDFIASSAAKDSHE